MSTWEKLKATWLLVHLLSRGLQIRREQALNERKAAAKFGKYWAAAASVGDDWVKYVEIESKDEARAFIIESNRILGRKRNLNADVIWWKSLLMKPRPKPKLHHPPGFTLQAFADFFFCKKTYTEVFEPAIRDLQDEHNESLAKGQLWKAQYVLIRGYCSFWSAVSAQMSSSLIKLLLKAVGMGMSSSP